MWGVDLPEHSNGVSTGGSNGGSNGVSTGAKLTVSGTNGTGGQGMNWFLVIAAVFVTWVVFNWLLNVIKTTVSTAITIAAIILVLQLAVGIGPQQLLDTVTQIPRLALELFQHSKK
jgi:hypothetical protein